MKMVTINGKEVQNPFAAIFIALTVISFVVCMVILLASFFVVMLPLLLIGIGLGVLVEYGTKKRKIDDWMWIFGMKMYEWVIREEMRFWSL